MRILLAVMLLVLAGCGTPAITPTKAGVAPPPLHGVAQVDLPRFMGQWFVIARIPYGFERRHVGSYREFSLRPDGSIDDRMFFHDGKFDSKIESREGRATVREESGNARWSVDFGLRFSEELTIVYVDPEYRHAVIGHASRNYAWVLARHRYMNDRAYGDLLHKLYEQDYHTVRLVQVPQTEDFVGVPGFQEP